MLVEWRYDHYLTEDYQGETVNSDIAERTWNSKFRPLTNVNNALNFQKHGMCLSPCFALAHMSSLSIFAEACPCCHFLFRISGCQFLQENWSALSIFARKFVRFVIFCKWHQQFWSGGQAVGSRPNTALSHTLWNSKIFKTFFLKYIKKHESARC